MSKAPPFADPEKAREAGRKGAARRKALAENRALNSPRKRLLDALGTDFERLVDVAVDIALARGDFKDEKPDPDLRYRAAKELISYFAGRPYQQKDEPVEGDNGPAITFTE